MAHYTAKIIWTRDDQDFVNNRYSRKHVIQFDGGVEIPASSSPHVVAPPLSDASAVDPEEMFVASLSSCHMLWFLSIAARHKFCVERYVDAASGIMEKNSNGRFFMSRVTLRPEITFSGELTPTHEEFYGMHHAAHQECFIANSVQTDVCCEPIYIKS